MAQDNKPSEAPAEAPKLTRKIDIEVIRKNGESVFNFSVDQYITEIYKSQSEGIKESQSWPGNKFYSVPRVTQNEAYISLLRNYGLYDDYGNPLLSTGRGSTPLLNIAWLRTVEGKGTIRIEEPLSVAELSKLVKNASIFIKEYFTEYFQEARIKGSVSIEL